MTVVTGVVAGALIAQKRLWALSLSSRLLHNPQHLDEGPVRLIIAADDVYSPNPYHPASLPPIRSHSGLRILKCWEEERRQILKDVSFSILRNQLFLSFHSSLVPTPCLYVIVLTNLFLHFHQQNKLKPILVLQFNPDLSNGSRCVAVEACFSYRRHNHSSVKLCMCHMESKVKGKFTVSLS